MRTAREARVVGGGGVPQTRYQLLPPRILRRFPQVFAVTPPWTLSLGSLPPTPFVPS